MQPDAAAHAATSPASLRKRLRGLQDQVVAEPWGVMTFVWQTLKAALLPISLRDAPHLLDRFLEHLQRSGTVCRPRRAEVFLRNIQEMHG